MVDKKPPGRGVVDSIAALRERRYMTRGPGAKVKVESVTHKRIEQLQQLVDAVPPTKTRAQKKAAKKRSAKRGR